MDNHIKLYDGIIIISKPFFSTVNYNENTRFSGHHWHIIYNDTSGNICDGYVSLQDLFDLYLTHRKTNSEYYEESEKCYCGHTQFCSCCDPDIDMFEEHLKVGRISYDKENGWG